MTDESIINAIKMIAKVIEDNPSKSSRMRLSPKGVIDIIKFTILIVSLIAAAAVGIHELNQGPAQELEKIQQKMEAMQSVQSYIIEHNAWLGDAVIELSEGKSVSAKPKSLRDRETELLAN